MHDAIRKLLGVSAPVHDYFGSYVLASIASNIDRENDQQRHSVSSKDIVPSGKIAILNG